jgi:uncharacterized membrane protein
MRSFKNGSKPETDLAITAIGLTAKNPLAILAAVVVVLIGSAAIVGVVGLVVSAVTKLVAAYPKSMATLLTTLACGVATKNGVRRHRRRRE